jgi:hypothetical protein
MLNRDRSNKERGQILAVVALMAVVLIGFAGLVSDLGYLYVVRRSMQTATDGAAVAAANQYSNNTWSQAAADVAGLNGFSDGKNGTKVTAQQIATPNGYPSGVYFQVTITRPVSTFFLRVLGMRTLNMTTTALSGNVDAASTLIALNGNSSGITVDDGAAVTVGGGASNSHGGCGVVSNASLTNHGSISAPSIGVVGGCSGTQPANLRTNVPPASNPLAFLNAPSGNTCSRRTGNTGRKTCNSTQTVSPAVYTDSNQCGYVVTSPQRRGSYTPISVTFQAGTYGDHISIGGTASGQPSGTVQNATVTFNPGQFQCDQSRFATPSVEVGSNCSQSTIVFNPGNYTFLGKVSISNNNTVTLSPGTYYGGITIQDGPQGSPNVTFQPGTYYLGGGGLNVSGGCSLHGSGVTFYNTSDNSSLGSASGPISIGANSDEGDNIQCSLSAPTSGSMKGVLVFQDQAIGSSKGRSWHSWWWSDSSSGAHDCSVQGSSGSTFDGAVYTPNASLKYKGSSSGSGYTVVVADSIELTGGSSTQVSCDYSSLSDGLSPIKTAALFK